jgi:hypothetical protein
LKDGLVKEAGISCTGVEKCPLRLSTGKASEAGRPSPTARRKLSGKRRKLKEKRRNVLFSSEKNESSIQRETSIPLFPVFQES